MKKFPFEHRIKKDFQYTPAANTNVAATFQRVRRAIEEAAQPTTNVRPLARKTAGTVAG